jgi:hypothetical protein
MFEADDGGTTTDNPIAAGSASILTADGAEAATFADLEAALTKFGGAEHAAQAVAVMERLMLAREDELAAKLEARLGGAAPLGSAAAVRSVVAQLTEAPPNFHQATSYFAATQAPEDAAMTARARLLFLGSVLMVLMQTVTAIGVCLSTVLPSCSSSAQCRESSAGTYCTVPDRNRCDFCGRHVPLEIQFDPATGGTLNWAEHREFVGMNLTLVAEVCIG